MTTDTIIRYRIAYGSPLHQTLDWEQQPDKGVCERHPGAGKAAKTVIGRLPVPTKWFCGDRCETDDDRKVMYAWIQSRVVGSTDLCRKCADRIIQEFEARLLAAAGNDC